MDKKNAIKIKKGEKIKIDKQTNNKFAAIYKPWKGVFLKSTRAKTGHI